MTRRFGLVLALLFGLLVSGDVGHAYWQSRDSTYNNVTTGNTYVGLGDIVSGAAGYYDCTFAYSGTYASSNGKMCQVTRASDSHTCDILSATSGSQGNTGNCSTGGDNGQTLTAFLTSTTGTWTIAYDQSGNVSRDFVVSGGAALGVSLTGVNGLTGMSCNGSTQYLRTLTITTIAEPTTIITVSRQPSAAVQGVFATISNGQFIYYTAAANTAGLGGGGGGILTATASSAAFHVLFGVFNGASPNTTLAVDGGTASTGTSSVGLGTGAWFLCALNNGTNLLNGTVGMVVIWPSAVTGTPATNVVSNLRAKWGTP